jgi:hypothetical protein
VVHYVSYGTPGGEYASECRAAVVTEVTPPGTLAVDLGDARPTTVGLCVLNPTGQFFNRAVPYSADPRVGGTWHWPERVDDEER